MLCATFLGQLPTICIALPKDRKNIIILLLQLYSKCAVMDKMNWVI